MDNLLGGLYSTAVRRVLVSPSIRWIQFVCGGGLNGIEAVGMGVKPHSIAQIKLVSRSGDLAEFSNYISYVAFHTRYLVALEVLFVVY